MDLYIQFVSQKDARNAGLNKFFNGKKCKRGGISERRTLNSLCLCIKCKEARHIRNSEYKKENIESIKLKDKIYRENNKEKLRDGYLRYIARHGEKRREYEKKYYDRCKDRLTKYQQEWYLKNKESINKNHKEYREKTKPMARVRVAARRCSVKQRTPAWFSEYDRFVMEECSLLCDERKKATGFDWHSDHMIPLSSKTASGLHCALNIQAIPGFMNIFKQNKMIFTERYEYLAYMG